MAFEKSSRPLSRCLRCTLQDGSALPIRSFTTARPTRQEVIDIESAAASDAQPPAISAKTLDANHALKRQAETTYSPRSERRLIAKHGIYPVGSRRRRAAIAHSPGIPFQRLPYQCFQEARKFLQEDRREKVDEIEETRRRIEKLRTTIHASREKWDAAQLAQQEHRLRSMKKRLEDLKIYADINDPIVKKTFEDGLGDMNKPIYRHLADLKWRSYKRKVLVQRVTQMNVVPDVLPHIDPTVSTSLSFGRKKIPHGDIVPSSVSEEPPVLNIQSFDQGDRWITIAVVNPDVPNVSKDAFDYRCHFLASNIRISPTEARVDLASLDPETQVIQNWLPAYAQKGLAYQRMAIFVLEQEPMEQDEATRTQTRALENKLATVYQNDISPQLTLTSGETTQPSDIASASASLSAIVPVPDIKQRDRYVRRENFILRSFSTVYGLKPIGVDLFRTQWDEGTSGVMRRANVAGWDVEFKRKRIEPLPYQRLKAERYR